MIRDPASAPVSAPAPAFAPALDPVPGPETEEHGRRKAVCWIVAAGELRETERRLLAAFPPVKRRDLLIAADGGVCYLREIGLAPDVMIGDFDSSSDSVFREVQNGDLYREAVRAFSSQAELLSYPVQKDDTDTMLAIKYGFRKGYRNFCLFGVLGGVLYHSVANLQALLYIAENGGTAAAFHGGETVLCLKDSVLYLPPAKESQKTHKFSVFSLPAESCGVFIKGAKYGLRDAVLTNSFPLGAGNSRVAGEPLLIGVKKGALLVIIS